MAKDVGTVVRHEPAPAPMSVAWVIAILTLLELVFAGIFVAGIALRWNSIEAKAGQLMGQQQFLAFCLANVFLILAINLALYRRFFLDDIVIVKKRKPKWEDIL